MIDVLELKTNNSKLDFKKIQHIMENVTSNEKGKFWLIWNHKVDCTILYIDYQ